MTSTTTASAKRTAWDVILGIVLVLGGLFLLGNAVFATAISVFVIGWTTMLSGVVLLAASFFRIKTGGFWSAVLGGAILAVIGLFILRNPVVGAVALTLGAGVTFFVSGLTRMAWAFGAESGRLLLILSGLVSLGLGFFVLFNLGAATLTLLGTLLGIQTLLEGLNLMMIGRARPEGKKD